MKFPSPIILIMSYSTLLVNFMLLLSSIDLFFLSNVSLPKYRFSPPRCFTWVIWFMCIIKIGFNMYLSKHSWKTHFCSPNTPRWQPPVYLSLSLSLSTSDTCNNDKHTLYIIVLCYLLLLQYGQCLTWQNQAEEVLLCFHRRF